VGAARLSAELFVEAAGQRPFLAPENHGKLRKNPVMTSMAISGT